MTDGEHKKLNHHLNLLSEALWEVLKAAKVLNDEIVPNGPELLMHAEDYAKDLREGLSQNYRKPSITTNLLGRRAYILNQKNGRSDAGEIVTLSHSTGGVLCIGILYDDGAIEEYVASGNPNFHVCGDDFEPGASASNK